MKRNGGWMRARGRDQLAILKVRERALNGASRQSGGACDGLMGYADRPIRLLGRLTIEEKVDDERSRTAVMADQVGQEAIEQVRVKRQLYHRLV